MRTYLDYAATAPLEPAALAALGEASSFANPSSVHADGRRARAALEAARARIARGLGWDGAIVFTSGGTEALALALDGAAAGPRLVSAVEHAAVLAGAPGATVFAVDADGVIDLAGLERVLAAAAAPALVAVMHANNETGVVQPVAEVARLARAAGANLLVDAVQSAGKLDLPDADFVAVSAHKLGGPPGVGALLVRDPAALAAGRRGGGQERGYRGGTENLPGILGFAAAVDARTDRTWLARAATLRDALEARLMAAGGEILGGGAARLPTIACVRMPGVEAMVQLIALDLAGFAVSAGAACSSGRVKASHVLLAMGLAERAAGEAIRVSIGWATTAAAPFAPLGAKC